MNPAPTTNAAIAVPVRTRGERLRAARAKRFPSARSAAIALGIPVSTYGAHERAEAPGGRDYSPEEAERYARRFGVKTEWLLTGYPHTAPDKKPAGRIAVIWGYIGLNEEVHLYRVAPELLVWFEVPELINKSTVAYEIRGSCLGRYYNHWHLIYDDLRLPPTPDLIGAVCMVALKNGRRFVRRLQEGEAEGQFDLITQAGAGPAFHNVEIVWAAKIKALMQTDRRRLVSEKSATLGSARFFEIMHGAKP